MSQQTNPLDKYLNSPLGKILNPQRNSSTSYNPVQTVNNIRNYGQPRTTIPTAPPATGNTQIIGNYNLASSATGSGGQQTQQAQAQDTNWQQYFDEFYNPIKDQAEKWANEMINQAQGDFDFVAKWIESEYKKAVGSDDKQTQAFLDSVANKLEEKVGRIQFDYETGKYRKEEDRQTIEDTRSKLLTRLDQDQQLETKNLLRETREGRQNLGEGLNERGLINGSMKEGLVGEEFRDYDTEVNDRFTALERAFGREREDVNLEADLGVRGINRDIEDLTTGARRGIIDETDERNMSTEEAQRRKESAIREANRQKELELLQGKGQAENQARNKLMYG